MPQPPPAPSSVPSSRFGIWLAGARPRTLPAAVVPVLVGTACAAGIASVEGGWTSVGPNEGVIYSATGPAWLKGLIVWRFVAALVVSLFIQIGTNYANDYSDGKRGTDDPGQRVGPPRLVGWGLVPARQVKIAAFASFAVAALAGLALAAAVGWWLILVGLVSFAAGWFYTGGPRPYGYAGFGEAFVFVFFGLVATIGSYYVQAERLATPWLIVGAAIAVGCLATALLVINNLRDIPSDTVSGKRTLAVRIGDRRTRILYVGLMVAPFVLVPFVCGLGSRPLGAASLFAIVLANQPVLQVLQGAQGRALIPVLGQTGRVQLVFGILLALGVYLSAPTVYV